MLFSLPEKYSPSYVTKQTKKALYLVNAYYIFKSWLKYLLFKKALWITCLSQLPLPSLYGAHLSFSLEALQYFLTVLSLIKVII